MPPSRVFVIVNRNARKFLERPRLVDEVQRLAEGRAHVQVTTSRHDLTSAAAQARASGASVVLLCGGDGSYGAGATAVVDAWGEAPLPTFAFAPGGTVGTSARSMGVAVEGDTLSGIARVLHAACSDQQHVIDHATLAIAPDEARRRIAFIFGTGLVASFFELYDSVGAEAGRAAAQRGEPDADLPSGGVGRIGAAKIVARIFLESFVDGPYARRVLDPLRCDIEVDGTPLPWSASSLVVASVLRDLGLGMRVTHRAGEDPNRPHVVVSGLLPRRLGPRMLRVLRGEPIGNADEPHFDGLVSTLSVSFPGGPGPYVVDGDLRLARRVVVSAGPILRILRPGVGVASGPLVD
jgi:diacylglycerol kinase (ATP)